MSSTGYIKKSSEFYDKSRKEHYLFGDKVLFLLSSPLPEGVSAKQIVQFLEKLPIKLYQDLDYIFYGQFDELDIRGVESAYMRGAIYVSNSVDDKETLYSCLIHELAHSIETIYGGKIYYDNDVAAEFIGKRKKLRTILKANGYVFEDDSFYLRTEYNPAFDKFLSDEIGYEKLTQLVPGLYISPYAATSLREYFANGFEHFVLHDREYLTKVSPALTKKIIGLTQKK